MFGVLFKFLFILMILLEIGEYMLEVVLIDSTTSKDDFVLILELIFGSSTYTMLFNLVCCWMCCVNVLVYECVLIYCFVCCVCVMLWVCVWVFVCSSSSRSRFSSSFYLRVIGDVDCCDIIFDFGLFVWRYVF